MRSELDAKGTWTDYCELKMGGGPNALVDLVEIDGETWFRATGGVGLFVSADNRSLEDALDMVPLFARISWDVYEATTTHFAIRRSSTSRSGSVPPSWRSDVPVPGTKRLFDHSDRSPKGRERWRVARPCGAESPASSWQMQSGRRWLAVKSCRRSGGINVDDERRRRRALFGALGATVALAVPLIVVGVPPASAGMPAQVTPGTTSLGAVACPSANDCIAIGSGPAPKRKSVVVSITNGIPGTPAVVKVSGELKDVLTHIQLNAVACDSATTCVAVGQGDFDDPTFTIGSTIAGVIVPITDGTPGEPSPVILGTMMPGDPDSVNLWGVTCPSTGSCVAAGSDEYDGGVVVPIANGIPGNEEQAPALSLVGVSCHRGAHCWAIGYGLMGGTLLVQLSAGTYEYDGVATGLGFSNRHGDGGVGGVACGSVTKCEGFGNDVSNRDPNNELQLITNGVPGTIQPVPDNAVINGMACKGSDCVGVGSNTSGDGVRLVITDGTPGAAKIVAGTSSLAGVSCASRSYCLVVGSDASGVGVFDEVPFS